MSNNIRAILLVTCICITLLSSNLTTKAIHAHPAPAQALDPEQMGMVIRDPWYDFGTYPGHPNEPNTMAQERMGEVLEETGVRWVRLEFFVEGDDTEALTRTFARYDYFINTVAPRHGLKVLGLLSFGVIAETDPLDPNTGITAEPFVRDPIYGGAVNSYIQRWLKRALGIVTHYQDAVAAYEVLNEQNRLPPEGKAIPASLAARLHTKFYRLLKEPELPDVIAPCGTVG
ncbi:MAG: hypothetical protein HGA19_09555, partial [Oscillochloris sp.]|nr:hypothetical protein [Oscillochloris sp.]